MNLVIIQGNNITFSPSTATALGSDLFFRPVDDLFTDYGMIIPIIGAFGTTYQQLEGEAKYAEEIGRVGRALIVTHDEKVYENNHGHINRYIVTPGVQKLFLYNGDHDAVAMALHLTKGDALAAVDLLAKAYRFRYVDYLTMDIPSIAAKLKAAGKTKPFCETYFKMPDSLEDLNRRAEGKSDKPRNHRVGFTTSS